MCRAFVHHFVIDHLYMIYLSMHVSCLRAGLFVYLSIFCCYGNVLLRVVLASIVLPVIVLWFFMRCSCGLCVVLVALDRAFEPVGGS